MSKRILVLDGSKRASLAIIRALGKNKDNIIYVGSNNRLGLSLYSKYCMKKIIYRDNSLIEDLIFFLEKNKVDFIIPQFDSTIEVLSNNKDHIEKKFGCIIATPNKELLDKILDKDQLLDTAKKLNIKIPIQKKIRNIQDINDINLSFPLVLKPTKSYLDGKKGDVKFIFNSEQLYMEVGKYLNYGFDILLQEYIIGKGVGYFCLMDEKQEVIAEFSHERLRELDINGGSSVYCKSISLNDELRKQSIRLLKHLKWEGVCMVEYKKDEHGNYYLMEINGRFWGSLQLAITSGIDFPMLYLDYLMGKKIRKIKKFKEYVRVRWLIGDFYNLLQRLKGKETIYREKYSKTKALKEFIFCETDGYMVFALNDIMPFFVQLLKIIREVLTNEKKI